ncbi:hypothetical protein BT96DRAFT_771375, partial [Gymnopus androsaceus JB14]
LTCYSVRELWDSLIANPGNMVQAPQPIVIILDAFDECGAKGDSGPREILLSLLMNSAYKLPKNFRVLVTSRLESNVQEYLDGCSSHQKLYIQYMSKLEGTEADIHRYVVHRMMKRSGGLGFLDEDQCKTLADNATGYFQWAHTVCEALRGHDKAGLTVKARFKRFMSLARDDRDLMPLDKLYKSILEDTFDCRDPQAILQYKLVMAQILAACEPLSIQSLKRIQSARSDGEEYDEEGLNAVIPFLGSLFTGVNNVNTPIRPVHTSVRDFLLNEERSTEHAVDLYQGHETLAIGTLNLMISDLHFNICNFESSYVFNSEVKNLSEKISQNIAPELSYACLFWDSHILHIHSNVSLPLVEKFINKSLLFWVEVLAILGRVNGITNVATNVSNWIKSSMVSGPHIGKLLMHVNDILKELVSFIRVFGKMITESTPHLYLSGLPFIPEGSSLQKFRIPFKKLAIVCQGLSSHWPYQQTVIYGHTEQVTSVAFSPDGKRI